MEVFRKISFKKYYLATLIAFFLTSTLLTSLFADTAKKDLRRKVREIFFMDYGNTHGMERHEMIKALGKDAISLLTEMVHDYRNSCFLPKAGVECAYLEISIDVLGKLKVKEVADMILSLLEDPRTEEESDLFKEGLIEALGEIGNRKHLESIKKFVFYQNPKDKYKGYDVREQAIKAIGNIGDEREIDLLEKVRKSDSSEWIRHVAEKTIAKIKQKKKQK